LVVDRGAVRGDANLYLRNVLYRLYKDPAKKAKFEERIERLFPGLKLFADGFDENKHEYITVEYVRNGVRRPLDMVGTGTLQAIQILGYASFYQPVLLLLDEPDAHLHPDNQLKLVEALDLLSTEENLQILLATHSRHLLQAVGSVSDVASFHLKSGTLVGTDPDLSALLVDLGAVDKYEALGLNGKDWLILGEDKLAETDPNHPLRILLRKHGVTDESSLVMSFKGCTEMRSIALLAGFCSAHHPAVRLLVHRDRDFLTDVEVEELIVKPLSVLRNVSVYVTDGCDLEASFLEPPHVSEICAAAPATVMAIVQEVATTAHNTVVSRFNDKRQALHKQFRSPVLASTDSLRSSAIPLPADQRVGKDLLPQLERALRARGLLSEGTTLIASSNALASNRLAAALA